MPDNPSFTVVSQGYVKDAGGQWIPAVQPAGGSSSGGLTDAELRAAPVPVLASIDTTGLATSAGQTSQLTKLTSIDSKLTAPLLIDGSVSAAVTNFPTTQPVSGTVNVGNFPATQPVSLASVPSHAVTGPLTDTQLRAAVVPVSVGNFPATQQVSGSVTISNFPASQAVTGTFFQTTQPVSASALPLPAGASSETTLAAMSGKLPATVGQKTMTASLPVVIASDQGPIPTTKQPTGGTNVMKTGTITTTAVTADQVVLTYTVTAGKTFYLTYLVMYGRLTVLAATATILGAISLETPSGTKVITLDDVNPTTSELEFNPIIFSEPIPIAAGTVVRVVVTPAAATSMLWRANAGGYEK